jgi:hypothetical protein
MVFFSMIGPMSARRRHMHVAPAVRKSHERGWNAPKCDSHHILTAADVKPF